MMKLYITALLFLLISCKVNKPKDTSTVGTVTVSPNVTDLIRDCPDGKIINRMPNAGHDIDSYPKNVYYIYKGARKEIEEFDSTWVRNHCNVKTTTAY